MGKKNKKVTQNNIKEEIITFNEYLSIYNRNRVLDNVLKKWFSKIDNTNPKKSKSEWDILIEVFYNETEK